MKKEPKAESSKPLKATRHPRARWANAAKRLAQSGDDALVWPEFDTAEDSEWEW